MIAATIYISSRVEPMEKVPAQFGLIITSWQLPFFMMGIDCLSQQTIQAIWPHLLGIFSGHIYHFYTQVWPKLGGTARLLPPKWFLKLLKDKGPPGSVSFRNNDDNDKKSKLKKIKKIPIKGNSKGRKLNK